MQEWLGRRSCEVKPMRWFDKSRMTIRSLVRRRTVESELNEELLFHLERQIAENVKSGMTPGDARRSALIEFGGVESMKEECREARKASWIHDFAQDVRYAGRVLRKSPGFAAIAILTLALGIGANSAIFSVVNATLLKPLPFRHPEKVVALWQTESAPGSYPLTGEDYLDWKAQNHTFESLSLYSWPLSANATVGDVPEGATLVRTEANFFSLLGVSPQIGRTFATSEGQTGKSHVAILSNAFWKTRFGGARDVLDKSVKLDGEPYAIVGVMPGWYRLPADAEIWIPLDMSKKNLGTRGSHSWRAIGRVKESVTIVQARADLRTVAERYEKQFPDTNRNVDAIVTPMREDLVGDFSTQILIMFGAVGLVLLIACANVANLLLARSTSRQREIAVRNALGAGRGRLVRQLLTESVLLSLVGGVLGVAMAFGGVAALRSAVADTVPQPNPLAVDLAPLGFTFLLCIGVGMLFGLAPALHSAGVNSSEALKSRGAAGAGASQKGHWLRNFLVASEIALSLALLAGAGLLLRTFSHLRSTDIGVRGEHVLTAAVRLPEKQYKTLDQGMGFYDQLVQKLQSSPGVQAAAITTKLPLKGGTNGYVKIPGQETESMTGPLVEWSSISSDYFHVMSIPLLEGRELTREDFELTGKLVRELAPVENPKEMREIASKHVIPAVINQTMATTFWPRQSAIGKIFENFVQFQVVGVVGDVKQHRLRDKAMPEGYSALSWDMGDPSRPFVVVARAAGSPESLTSTVRDAVRSLDSSLALFNVRTMPQIVTASMHDTSYEAVLLGLMATLALVLASVGTYGVMSYVVGQRTNEIGIRMALGAQRLEIMGMILRQVCSVVGVGIALGLVGAIAGAQVIRGLLVGVAPLDPVTFVGVAALLGLVALLACYVPVRRAMRVDPVLALRYE
jgi:putative ABC transport system permease protein